MSALLRTVTLGALICTAMNAAADDPGSIDGLMRLEPFTAGACIAVKFDLPATEAISALRWQGCASTPWARILAASGAADLPPVYEDAIVVTEVVPLPADGWNTVQFEQPIASLSGSIFLIFEYADGDPESILAPAIGYAASNGGSSVYVSSDGDEWLQMATNYRLLVETVRIGRSGDMVALASRQPGHVSIVSAPRLSVYPNPFNPQTTISLTGVQGKVLDVVVYDLQGRRVRCLFRGPAANPDLTLSWNGLDDHGRRQGSGVYFIRASGKEVNLRTRVVLVK